MGDATKISFSSHKECREFINNHYDNLLFERNQIRGWSSPFQDPIKWEGLKIGKIIKIKGLSIYVNEIQKLTNREYNLEKILQ